MKEILATLGALLLLAVAYLLLWPVPITPAAFSLPKAPGSLEPHAVNTRLANLKTIDLKGEVGPEHIMDGKIWMGFAKPRNPTADNMTDKPWLRRLTLRLPRAFWPVHKSYGHVVAFTEDGKIVADLQDPSGAYPETTAITETKDRLYIQSLHAHGLGWLPKP